MAELVEKDAEKRIFNYLSSGRIHASILLVGHLPAESLQIAKKAAQFLVCQSTQSRPCGKCSTCTRVERGLYPDVVVLESEEVGTIKVDTIRALCHQMEVSPLEGTRKVCIIPNAEQMTTAASNAFLKTLEEPLPERYFWLLSSRPGAILPTILSRCIQFHLRPHADLARTGEAEMQAALQAAFQSKEISALRPYLEKKETTLELLQALQRMSREAVLQDPLSKDALDSLQQFSRFLKVEGRLRSSANHELMLESALGIF